MTNNNIPTAAAASEAGYFCLYCGGGSSRQRPLLFHFDGLQGGDCYAHDRCSERRY